MTDTEERLANLQKLLDRVLTRADDGAAKGEEDDGATKSEADADASVAAHAANGDERSEARADATRDEQDDAREEKADAAQEEPSSDRPTPDVVSIAGDAEPKKEPLESRSRLVAAAVESTMELSEEDLIPESELPEAAMPLIRRSRTLGEMPVREAPPSEGRIVVEPHEVHVAGDALTDDERLAAEIAAEEVHSSELEEEEPTSSRRPIAAEVRHTPPPESGRQVAALAEDEGVASGKRKSSVPPAGGAPDVIAAGLAAGANVAAFRGGVTPDRPGSFGELIDWALEI